MRPGSSKSCCCSQLSRLIWPRVECSHPWCAPPMVFAHRRGRECRQEPFGRSWLTMCCGAAAGHAPPRWPRLVMHRADRLDQLRLGLLPTIWAGLLLAMETSGGGSSVVRSNLDRRSSGFTPPRRRQRSWQLPLLSPFRSAPGQSGSVNTISAQPWPAPSMPGMMPSSQPPQPTGTATNCLPSTL